MARARGQRRPSWQPDHGRSTAAASTWRGIRERRRIGPPRRDRDRIDDAAGLVAELTVVAGPSDGHTTVARHCSPCWTAARARAARARAGLAGIDPDGPVTLSVRGARRPADAVRPGPPGPDRPRALVRARRGRGGVRGVRHRTTVRATRHGVHEGADARLRPGRGGDGSGRPRRTGGRRRPSPGDGRPGRQHPGAARVPPVPAGLDRPGPRLRVVPLPRAHLAGRTTGWSRSTSARDGSDPVALRVLDAPQPWRLPFEPGLR
ncbi:hypothetical protein HX744_00675 [Pseudonocardia sp. ICBG1122]|nr:hypothetical protein [Pseudonocardia pini]